VRFKVAGLACAALVAGAAWLWFAPDAPREAVLPGADNREAPEARSGEESPRGDLRPGPLPGVPSETNAPRRPVAEGGAARWPTRAMSREPTRAVVHPSEPAEESADPAESGFEELKRRLAALRAVARESGAGQPIDAGAAGLDAVAVEQIDLDRDGELSSWELATLDQITERAERFPRKSDLADGAYPIERADYGRPEWEFDSIDTNRDGEMDVDEEYAFLLDAARTTVALDSDGDGQVSYDESGLSAAQFDPLDRDGSGMLQPWEIRRAIALGGIPGASR